MAVEREKRLTARIPERLHYRFKLACATGAISMNDVIIDLLMDKYPETAAPRSKKKKVAPSAVLQPAE